MISAASGGTGGLLQGRGPQGALSKQRLSCSLPMRRRPMVTTAASAVDPPDLKKLAEMAHIGITDAEVEEFTPQIQNIWWWFGELAAVDVEGVEPALRAMSGEDTARSDSPVVFPNRVEMLEQVPDREDVYVKVPKIGSDPDA